MQRTLVIIKPDAVALDFWIDIIKVYERAGLTIEKAAIHAPLSREIVESLYQEHKGKSFYAELVLFMQVGPSVALCVAGLNAVQRVRSLNGATKPCEAEKGTIRSLYSGCAVPPANAVHGSANLADAERELKLIFREK